MGIDSGKLNKIITIQQPVKSQDPVSGDEVVVWENLFTDIYAAIEPLSVRDFVAAQAAQSEIVARVIIRYREGLTASMRILHKSEIYSPAGWLPDMESGVCYLTAPVSLGLRKV